MFLNALTWFIGYRFRDCLRPNLQLPRFTPAQDVKDIKEKARASSAVAGVFLAFAAAFLVALISTQELGAVLESLSSDKWTLLLTFLGMIFPYLILREERRISAAPAETYEALSIVAADQTSECGQQSKPGEHNEAQILRDIGERRRRHYLHLALWSLAPSAMLVFIWFCSPSERLPHALSLSGFFLIVVSMLLLVLSVEFYDTAGSWQAGDDKGYHFHMASIASHCYLMGLSLSLVGVSLLFCLRYLRMGYTIAAVVLFVLIAMTEVERDLFRLRKL